MMQHRQESIPRHGTAQEIVQAVIQYAVFSKSSDIHIEPLDDSVRIRMRRDGVLVTAAVIAKEKLDTLTARIKIMAKLDIANKRLPQDGHFVWQEGDRRVDMRVSTMPTIRGEKTVIRLLDTGGISLELDALGMEPPVVAALRRLTHCSKGLFIYSGPTGSGKSTTMYAALRELQRDEISIATLEDPVEYKINGFCQSQIQLKQGLAFQNGLRALLRQDPDVLVIGEIRDAETARIAVRAALTGHVVFSTIHASRAVDVPIRLMDMGIEPYLIADALLGMSSQRLARRLCPSCSREADDQVDRTVRQHQGCPSCFQSGYAGRFSLCEIIPVGFHVKQAVRHGCQEEDMEQAACADGAILMEEVIAAALQNGMTDTDEIHRIYDIGALR